MCLVPKFPTGSLSEKPIQGKHWFPFSFFFFFLNTLAKAYLCICYQSPRCCAAGQHGLQLPPGTRTGVVFS